MVKAKPLPDQKTLKELLDYDHETGKLYHKHRDIKHFLHCKNPEHQHRSWNSNNAGREFGTINASGYVIGMLQGKIYYAHRIVWKWVTGNEPDIVDHEKKNKIDNRFENLNDGTSGDNNRHHKIRGDNTSGYTGVVWCKRRNKWLAVVRFNKQCFHCGYFTNKKDAARAVEAKRKQLGFHPDHGAAV